MLGLQAPVAEIKADEKNGELHTLRMNVRSQRDAYAMALRFDGPVQPVSMKISGRDVAPNQNSSNLILVLYGMGTQGADVEFTFKASAGVSCRRTFSAAQAPGSLISCNACSNSLRSVISRIALETSVPSSVSSGLKLISMGNSVPSLRRP